MALTLLLLTAALAAAAAGDAPPCAQRPPQAHYSSKTAYQLVHDDNVTAADHVRGCEAVYFWHLLRHGTRYPNVKEIDELTKGVPPIQARLRESAAAGRAALCPADVERMLTWKLNATKAHGNMLTVQGERDMEGIAGRFRSRFPAFFTKHAHADQFQIRSTDAQRTQASAKCYGERLFSEPIDIPTPLAEDPLLKFYAMCPLWERAVDKNASARAEVDAFIDGEVMRASLERVSKRLGFEETLTYKEVEVLWEACRYDQAWEPTQDSPWCAAFDDEDLMVFEYRADVKYYYVTGYGNAVNLQLGCVLVKDIIDKLSAHESLGKSGAMYFTHSTAIHMTLAGLGIGRDAVPLTADNFATLERDRRWSISRLGPFAANLAAVLYECPEGENEKYKVRMYLNEEPVPVEGCSDADALCSWSDFRNRFAAAESCSLDFCNATRPNGSSPMLCSSLTWATVTALILRLISVLR